MKSLALYLIFGLASSALATSSVVDSKQKKGSSRSFSIFSVVQFGNSICVATTSTAANTVYGTCYTSSECQSNGGTGTGSCASGFGVCCVITQSTCGATISKNVTYIQNPGFPTGITSTGTCSYSVSTTTEICQIRLDFVNFVISNPSTTGACPAVDRLAITSPSGAGNGSPPAVCGTLSGSHMYVETGRSTTPTQIAISNSALITPARSWQIRVTQLECGSPAKAPTDCLQYFTGVSNRFTSFNYQNGVAGTGQLLNNLNYHACIRQEEGFCTIQYRQNDGATAGFKVTIGATMSMTACMNGELVIPSAAGFTNGDSYCGAYLNSIGGQSRSGIVTGVSAPFDVGVLTDATSTQNVVGFSLIYTQIPC